MSKYELFSYPLCERITETDKSMDGIEAEFKCKKCGQSLAGRGVWFLCGLSVFRIPCECGEQLFIADYGLLTVDKLKRARDNKEKIQLGEVKESSLKEEQKGGKIVKMPEEGVVVQAKTSVWWKIGWIVMIMVWIIPPFRQFAFLWIGWGTLIISLAFAACWWVAHKKR